MQRINYSRYFDEYDELKVPASGEDLWLKYLTETGHVYVNAERMESVEHVSSQMTVMYVMRTLDVLDDVFGHMEEKSDIRAVKYLLSTPREGTKESEASGQRQAILLIFTISLRQAFSKRKQRRRSVLLIRNISEKKQSISWNLLLH